MWRRTKASKIMEHYLFHGTQIQRNYCALYFGRKGEYLIIRAAFDKGLIDEKAGFFKVGTPGPATSINSKKVRFPGLFALF